MSALPVIAKIAMQPFVGVSYDMPAAIYHALPNLGSGAVTTIATRSPAHYRAGVEQKAEDGDEDASAVLIVGQAIHLGVLEPDLFERDVVAVPEAAPRRPTSAQIDAAKPSPKTVEQIAWWRDFDERARGKTVLTAEQHRVARGVIASVHRHPAARMLLQGGVSEVSIGWIDPETGAPGKGRLDRLRPDHGVVDLKSTRDASPRGFVREIGVHAYAIQAAHYRMGMREALRAEMPYWTFIAVEKEPPYAVGVYRLDPEAIDVAEGRVRAALATYAQCMETGYWPAYSDLIEPITPPAWAL